MINLRKYFELIHSMKLNEKNYKKMQISSFKDITDHVNDIKTMLN